MKGNARSKKETRVKLIKEMNERLHELFYDIFIYEKKALDKKKHPEDWWWDPESNTFKDGSDSLKRWLKAERKIIATTATTINKTWPKAAKDKSTPEQKAIRAKGDKRLKCAKYRNVQDIMKTRYIGMKKNRNGDIGLE